MLAKPNLAEQERPAAAGEFALMILDTDGKVSSVGSGDELIHGFEEQELVGQHISVLYPAEALASELPDLELAIATFAGWFQHQGWRVCKGGQRFWAQIILVAVRGQNEGLLGFGYELQKLPPCAADDELWAKATERAAVAAEAVRQAAADTYSRLPMGV